MQVLLNADQSTVKCFYDHLVRGKARKEWENKE